MLIIVSEIAEVQLNSILVILITTVYGRTMT